MNEPRGRSATIILVLVVTAVACALPIFVGLGERGLHGDEAIYVTVADRAARTAQWAPISLGQGNFVSKPPLLIWAIGASRSLLGDGEAAFRLPCALAGWLCCVVTLLLGVRLGSEASGCIAALLLATAPGLLHLHGFRDAVTEPWLMLVTASSLLVVVGLSGWRSWSGLALLSVANGLAKGLFGLAIVGGAILLARAGSSLRARALASASGAAVLGSSGAVLAAVFPGAVAYLAWLRFSMASWAEVGDLLHREVVVRARTGVDPDHLRPPSMILETVASDFGLFALVGFLGLVLALVMGCREWGDAELWPGRWLLASWIAATLVPVLLSRSRLPWYLYPAYPAIALAAGLALRDLALAARSRGRALAGVVVACVAVGGAHRAGALVERWPAVETRTLAALDRIHRSRPGARMLADAALFEPGGREGRLRRWNAFYLRSFERIEPGSTVAVDRGCTFLVTARPEAWEAVEERLSGIERVTLEKAAEGDMHLVVFDLCGGIFAIESQDRRDR